MTALSNPIFHDEAKAREHLEAIRWPDGPYCPHFNFFPYVGHQTATMSDKIGLLRLEFVSRPDQRDQDAHALQLALSRDQARELPEDLLRLADAPHIPRPPTDSQH